MPHILQISFYKQAKNYLLLIHSLAWWISPIFIMESRIHSLRNLCGNVLAGTFVLMKGDFGVSKCNISNLNTRYYPFSLWCDLNGGGVWLSHGQSQIRAWYPQGGQAEKHDRRQKRPVPVSWGNAAFPRPGKLSVNYRAWKNTHRNISMTSLFLLHMYRTRWFMAYCRSLSVKLFRHFG